MCENFHRHSTYPANHFIWSPEKSVTLPSCHVAVVISACVVEKIHDLVEEWTCANSTCTTTYPCSSIVVKIMLSIYQYHMKASNCFTNHCHAGRVVEYSLCFGGKRNPVTISSTSFSVFTACIRSMLPLCGSSVQLWYCEIWFLIVMLPFSYIDGKVSVTVCIKLNYLDFSILWVLFTTFSSSYYPVNWQCLYSVMETHWWSIEEQITFGQENLLLYQLPWECL